MALSIKPRLPLVCAALALLGGAAPMTTVLIPAPLATVTVAAGDPQQYSLLLAETA